MHATAFAGPMAGLPDPDRDRQFYDGVPARRLAAWFVDLVVVLAIGVPVAVFFGLVTLGFGFALFPLVVAGVGFLYRTATIAAGSATWGMRSMGIEFRRGDGTRFDLADGAAAHRYLYRLHRRGRAAVDQLRRPSSAPATARACRHHPRHHRDQPPGRLSPGGRTFTAAGESCCPPPTAVVTLRRKGESTRGRHAPQPAAVAPVLRHGAAAVPVSARQGRAQAVHRAAGRRRPPPERRAVAPGLPPLAERALPPVLRRLLRLPLGAHRGAPTSRRRAASAGCCAATPTSSGSRAAPGRPRRSIALFRRYLDARHATGGMADMDMSEFAAMIEETPVSSRVIEYYRPRPAGAAASSRRSA